MLKPVTNLSIDMKNITISMTHIMYSETRAHHRHFASAYGHLETVSTRCMYVSSCTCMHMLACMCIYVQACTCVCANEIDVQHAS
jgi:hypothetical protein